MSFDIGEEVVVVLMLSSIILIAAVIYGIVVFLRHRRAISYNVDRYMKTGEAGSLSSSY